jgi:hypothetical protein
VTWLNAARGEFNATPPSPAEQRRKEMRELARDQPKIEPALPVFTLPKF